MHELSIMTSILNTVDGQARSSGARKVRSINLVVGERTSFVDDALLFYFDMLTPGTLCEGAQLVVTRTPMRFHCRPCNQAYLPGGGHYRCPTCDTIGQLTSDGSELLLKSVEIEV